MSNNSYTKINEEGGKTVGVNLSEIIVITFTDLKKFNPLIKFKYKVLKNFLHISFNKILTSEEKNIAKGDLSSITSNLIEATNIVDIFDHETTTLVLQII